MAYSAVVFMRVQKNDHIVCHNICSKTKVAPIKKVTLPRLELCGADLLAQLMNAVQKAISLPISEIYAWSDAAITLSWIQGNPQRWKTFLGNKVPSIHEFLSPSQWHHVRTEDNPADIASRGISTKEFIDHSLWRNGPSFLYQSTIQMSSAPINDAGAEEEPRNTQSFVTTTVDISTLLRFSSFRRLLRVTAYCQRFIGNLRKYFKVTGFLKTDELNKATQHWIRTIQSMEFSPEISAIVNNDDLHHKSKLLQLNPFLDSDGLLRVGGRIQNSNHQYDRKHPIILSRNSHLTNLIVEYEHKKQLHAGPQLLLASLRQKYWILCGRDVVRRCVHKCIQCHRLKGDISHQLMGNLPRSRLNLTRPFLNVGLDFAGPITLRSSTLRGSTRIKAYIAVFLCFATKACHLELVSSLSSETFLAALKRFMSRRGKCSTITSDNGTTFVGADNILQGFLNELRGNEEINNFTSKESIIWNFIPPANPHHGGLWEAGVKSMKFHLRRTMGNSVLSYEELLTLLNQVESCMTSRPLCPMSSDPNDLQVLTPGHFIIGDALNSTPEPDYTTTPMNRLNRWQLTQKVFQHFWQRWNQEYLSTLQQRPKWMKTTINLEIDDLVIIKEDNQPPLKWKLGRITEVHPGTDELVRVVTLRTETGIIKRPIVKLSKLPIERDP